MGVVTAVGEGVTGVSPGQRVTAMGWQANEGQGSWQQCVNIKAEFVVGAGVMLAAGCPVQHVHSRTHCSKWQANTWRRATDVSPATYDTAGDNPLLYSPKHSCMSPTFMQVPER